jgi:large subunit ribosomal protein L17e
MLTIYSNPYQGHPCHIEVILSTPSSEVPRAKDLDVASSKKGQTIAAIEA